MCSSKKLRKHGIGNYETKPIGGNLHAAQSSVTCCPTADADAGIDIRAFVDDHAGVGATLLDAMGACVLQAKVG